MNNFNKYLGLHTFKTFLSTVIIALFFSISISAQEKDLNNPQLYTLNEITVAGAQNFNEQTVIAFAGLKKGDKLYIPGEKLSQITKKLW